MLTGIISKTTALLGVAAEKKSGKSSNKSARKRKKELTSWTDEDLEESSFQVQVEEEPHALNEPAARPSKRKRRTPNKRQKEEAEAAAEAEQAANDAPRRSGRLGSQAAQQPAARQELQAHGCNAQGRPQQEQQAQQQQQQGSRSPTPAIAAAAGQVLEMSEPPSTASGGSAAARRRSKRTSQQRAKQQRPQQLARAVPPAAAVLPEAGPAVDDEEGREEQAAAPLTNSLAAVSSFLLQRITLPRSEEAGSMQLRPRLQEACDSLRASLDNTVELGHNNSVLVVGPRGSGKTLMTERALAQLEARWNTTPRDPAVGVIRLTGLAHADERTAFREIARQLCDVFQCSFSKAASIGENISFLRGMLERLASCDKSAVFVLDEFDLFATKRSKQTLLYNLLDSLQTSGMQAAVVGLSCRQDVVEMLEKRVKSRFSHRKLDLSLPTSVMPVAPRDADDVRAADAGQDGALEVLQSMLTLPPTFPQPAAAQTWNPAVEAATAAPEVRTSLQRCINIYPSMRHLALIASMALSSLDKPGAAPGLTPRVLGAAVVRLLACRKSMVTTISGLPILDLILLVAVHRVRAKGADDFNFEMAHNEFSKYTLHGRHVDTYSKGAAAKAYDHLLSQGLVAFVDPRSEVRVGARPYAAAYLQVTREEIEEGMEAHWLPQQSLMEWFKREAGLGTTAGQFLSGGI
ncbi:hypothetical protein D9Q98_004562 [Chlorella vulgaris]|uniref:Origin recognition complex subunit 4 n=1 Tax=Chlorella vulgaris TaxID=3077 RepID=A0A9D4TQ38_CHLVU|nr:hypothetical protein D9Q98_004562 [Chlorella vulgaris]